MLPYETKYFTILFCLTGILANSQKVIANFISRLWFQNSSSKEAKSDFRFLSGIARDTSCAILESGMHRNPKWNGTFFADEA